MKATPEFACNRPAGGGTLHGEGRKGPEVQKYRLLLILMVIAGLAGDYYLLRSTPGPEPAATLTSTLEGVQSYTLPMATANNAVATLEVNGTPYLYSFSGLGPGKTRHDIHSRALALDLESGQAEGLGPVPGGADRTTTVAAARAST